MIGSKLGDYEILRLIGKGGMGAVYEALKPSINRRVAIKLLLPEYAEREDVVRRFINEARAVNAINHPGVVQIFDVGKSTAGSRGPDVRTGKGGVRCRSAPQIPNRGGEDTGPPKPSHGWAATG